MLARNIVFRALTALYALIAIFGSASAQSDGSDHASESTEEERAPKAGYVRVPGGEWLHKSCVHEVPDNSSIDLSPTQTLQVRNREGKLTTEYPPCAFAAVARPIREQREARPSDYPAFEGWVESSRASTTSFFTHLSVDWVVPGPPASKGALIYLFNGLSSDDRIIQPVLQYGSSNCCGGGNYWSISNFRVIGTNVGVYTTRRTLSPNQRIRGTINADSCTAAGNCNWLIGYSIDNEGNIWFLYQTNQPPMRRATFGALEVYRFNACNKLPAVSAEYFTDIMLRDSVGNDVTLSIPWTTQVATTSPSCGWSATNVQSARATVLGWSP